MRARLRRSDEVAASEEAGRLETELEALLDLTTQVSTKASAAIDRLTELAKEPPRA